MDARELTIALGGRWSGSYGVTCCPSHDDQRPSLTVREGDTAPLVFCQAGCAQRDVLDALRARGLWSAEKPDGGGRASRRREVSNARDDRDRERRIAAARAIWQATRPAVGTLVEVYLKARGITLAPPPSLRFHPALKHAPTGLEMPAMVAAVQAVGRRIVGVHRTYLVMDGTRKAQVSEPRMSLGSLRGGAVRLAKAGDELVIAEGIESALSVIQATGRAVWAALSTSGLAALELPPGVREIIIAGDADDAGRAAAAKAARRWQCGGVRVRIAMPNTEGEDWNDVLVAPANVIDLATRREKSDG